MSKKTARNEEIKRLRREGLTLAAIGKRYDLSKQRVSVILKEHSDCDSLPNIDGDSVIGYAVTTNGLSSCEAQPVLTPQPVTRPVGFVDITTILAAHPGTGTAPFRV